LGLRVEFVNLSYDGLYDALAAEQVDVLISALVVDPTRMDDFAYTEPYFNAGQVFVVRADGPAPQRMDDLAGHRLAVELGSDGDVEARRWTRRLAGMEVQPWPEAVSALAAVEVGQADVALVDTITARMVMREHLDLHLSGDPVTYEPYAIVVQQRHETLLGAIAQALSSLQADGTLADLLQRWL
jgi:polar amino acid transport system substrate-binding protein